MSSRTFWTLVVMCVYNILNVYGHYLSPSLSDLVNIVLSAVAGYFKISPSQNYNSPTVQAQPISQ
jgi:hypothetical protein